MTLIIAEAGVNHNGDLDLAFELVEKAAASGADIIKFQTFEANSLVTKAAEKANYQRSNTSSAESHYQMIKNLELKKNDHYRIIEHCRKHNIEFFSSAFDLDSLDFLASLNLSRYKVPSGEITNLPYLRQMGAYQKPIILSTGMSNMDDIDAALVALESAGASRDEITVLHCSTEYPAPIGDVNLNALRTIRESFNVDVGYSDHTSGIEVAIAAVALGATVIEKHITLDRSLPGPDHSASLEIREFTEMVGSIRNIEKAMGNGIKVPSAIERSNMAVARKSIVAHTFISKGQKFTYDNLAVKRPGTGISPMKIDSLIGKRARKDFYPDEIISV